VLRGDGDAWISLGGWLALDVIGFSRTEVEYGTSRHVEPVLASARISTEFQLNRNWGGRLDGEFAEANPSVQEAWFEFRRWKLLRLRAGRVKVPFGLAPQMTLPEYSLISAPVVFGNSKDFRDAGVMIHGDWENGVLAYSLAVVNGSRDVSVDVNEQPDLAGRLLLHPPINSSAWLSGLRGGVSATWGSGPTRHGFRGRTLAGHTFYAPPVIRCSQLRLGAELDWDTPWFRVTGEYVSMQQERDGVSQSQKVGTTYVPVKGLSGYDVSGWYVEGLWRVWNRGAFPAVELAGRYERLDFGDGERLVDTDAGTEDRSPLKDSWMDGITAGVNVRLTREVRLTLAWQGLRFGDPSMAPDAPLSPAPKAGTDLSTEDPATSPPSDSGWVHHLFLRLQFAI
jgi:hypothetical protein